MIAEQTGLTVRSEVHFRQICRGHKRLAVGGAPAAMAMARVPRLARLMALAIRFEEFIHRGEIRDYAELARVGHVTRARVTQIMNLLNLAPDIQEAVLFLPEVDEGSDPIKEWQVRPIASTREWRKQRRMWRELTAVANQSFAAAHLPTSHTLST
jgi:hypothetical protein